MASSLAQGITIIKGAAAEPHVQNLTEMLQKMGAKIKGASTHSLRIEGVEKLKGASHSIIPDPIEAGTFLAIGAGCYGRVLVKGAVAGHLDLFLEKLKQMGVSFEVKNKEQASQAIEVVGGSEIKPVKVQALPYPGFPTDLLPLVVPLLTQARGKSLIHDPLYENRLQYTQELRKMGADIEIVDPHRAFVFGLTPLHGVSIESWDIRAGASLIVAGLMAQGKTTINNIEQIDRGYEEIERRLQNLGADIKRKC
jgi:UDP-N-acetylglucosamine 1-carboxyvinyltransferase